MNVHLPATYISRTISTQRSASVLKRLLHDKAAILCVRIHIDVCVYVCVQRVCNLQQGSDLTCEYVYMIGECTPAR